MHLMNFAYALIKHLLYVWLGVTPLMLAVRSGDELCVQLLMAAIVMITF